MSESNSTQAPGALPNPLTPLAFLPPDLATQFEVSRYIYAATLGAFIWDIGINLGSDYRLLFKHRIRFPTIVYFLSRIFTMSYILTSFVFQVGDVGDCQALQVALGVCYILSQGGSAFLFYLRVKAVWINNPLMNGVFLVLWVCFVGASVTVPVGIGGAHIGPTKKCFNTRVADYTEAIAIVGLLNDTAIFAAVTYRILTFTIADESVKTCVNAFFSGRGLSRLSRALLQGGQHYYLIAVCGNIVLLVMIKDPHVPPVYHGMMTIPVVAVINAMACLVFRKIRFGLISSDGTTHYGSGAVSSIKFRATPGRNDSTLPTHYRRDHTGDVDKDSVTVNLKANEGISYPLHVHIVKEAKNSQM